MESALISFSTNRDDKKKTSVKLHDGRFIVQLFVFPLGRHVLYFEEIPTN